MFQWKLRCAIDHNLPKHSSSFRKRDPARAVNTSPKGVKEDTNKGPFIIELQKTAATHSPELTIPCQKDCTMKISERFQVTNSKTN